MKTQVPLWRASELAEQIKAALSPVCERIEIAGSVRRYKAVCGDIEIVAIPMVTRDLVGDVFEYAIDGKLQEFLRAKRLAPGRCNGPRFKQFEICAEPGLGLDLFLVTAETWGVQLAIRTGPAEYSHRLVTPAAKGGLLDDRLRVFEGRAWRGMEPLETPEEIDFLHLAGGWVEPAERRG